MPSERGPSLAYKLELLNILNKALVASSSLCILGLLFCNVCELLFNCPLEDGAVEIEVQGEQLVNLVDRRRSARDVDSAGGTHVVSDAADAERLNLVVACLGVGEPFEDPSWGIESIPDLQSSHSECLFEAELAA